MTSGDRTQIPWVRLATLDLLEREAAATLDGVPATDEENAHLWLGRAAVHRHLGNQDAAHDAYNHALELAGEDQDRWIKQAVLRATEGSAAISEVRGLLSAVKWKPENVEAWNKLLNFQHGLGDPNQLKKTVKDAMEALSGAGNFSAGETHRLRELAVTLGRLGFHDESIAMFEATSASWSQLREAEPKNPELAKEHANALKMLAVRYSGDRQGADVVTSGIISPNRDEANS